MHYCLYLFDDNDQAWKLICIRIRNIDFTLKSQGEDCGAQYESCTNVLYIGSIEKVQQES